MARMDATESAKLVEDFFQTAKTVAERRGFHFDSDYEFDEWLAQCAEEVFSE